MNEVRLRAAETEFLQAEYRQVGGSATERDERLVRWADKYGRYLLDEVKRLEEERDETSAGRTAAYFKNELATVREENARLRAVAEAARQTLRWAQFYARNTRDVVAFDREEEP